MGRTPAGVARLPEDLRDQDDAAGRLRRSGLREHVPRRGADRSAYPPPERRGDHRPRRAERGALPRDGVGRGREPRRAGEGRASHRRRAAARGDEDRVADRRRTARRTRAARRRRQPDRPGPPGRVAGQRAGVDERVREDRRLRHRQVEGPAAPDARGRGGEGQDAVPVAGAARPAPHRSAQRHLLVRRAALRAHHRAAPVPRRDRREDDREHRAPRGRAAAPDRAVDAARVRGGGAEGALQGPEGPLLHRGRDAARHRSRGRRLRRDHERGGRGHVREAGARRADHQARAGAPRRDRSRRRARAVGGRDPAG